MSNPSNKPVLSERKWEILRQIGSIGRLDAAFGLFEFAKEHLLVSLRAKHPEWSESQLQSTVRERLMSIR
jgi:hypothetical protein